jgi:N-acetyl-beta-hexosaminidase
MRACALPNGFFVITINGRFSSRFDGSFEFFIFVPKLIIMKSNFILLFIMLGLGMTACHENLPTAHYDIVPLPKEVELDTTESFVLSANTKVYYPSGNSDLKRNALFLADYLEDILKYRPELVETSESPEDGIYLSIDSNDFNRPEAYELKVDNDMIEITGSDAAGVFYGIQTFRKSIPVKSVSGKIRFQGVNIKDFPEFGYRGMHLDVGRHFFTVDSVKRYVDMIAMHNMNRFHLHITEDQGWRMEIKKYPELTEIGSVRSGTVIGHNSEMYDTIPYGGFYTQEELRDLVQYAQERYISIIPEIDLPGHQMAALATYPRFGCTGGPYEVWKRWGVSDEVICAGNEEAMKFLEDVLAEVMDVFPSEYIHIGGDECPKIRWHDCPKCQAKIKELGLKADEKHSAEDYLQSYVMARMEQFVEGKGRHIIGWDEILEGELAPNATVMSWRGTEGGLEAARKHHDVIMTPNTYLYFDYYQTEDTEKEPVAIGGYLPVERVYSYNPLSPELTEEEKAHIIGVQANIWTEYIPTFKIVEYNALPRMAALSEIQWCRPDQREYKDFVRRCFALADLYDLEQYKYAKHIFDINVELDADVDQNRIAVVMSKYGDGDIYYSLDGSDPRNGTKYVDTVFIYKSCDLRAIVIRQYGTESTCSMHFDFTKSSMKPIVLKQKPHESYTFGGAQVLNDGIKGGGSYKTGRWLGFFGNNLDAIIDLQDEMEISKVSFDANVVKGDWIYNPKSVVVLGSMDGQNFAEITHHDYPVFEWSDADGIYPYEINFEPTRTRYVEVVVSPFDLPEDHVAYGYPGYVFVDEIEVR